ncbi:hypothetical protein A7A78_04630 [Aequorivita soesokkakensis]|uniref:Uncharacterized protein n=1 Tax=Aequorivita soesokkakensis TaxID=1385699 RepID=A0A1A9LEI8_9FLAO|nr:hypothetical protein [Aequorivita soesokkakensis]OAD91102.1 hypothetical protein A7A78_04630 [Aequorivita soesokkakensis]
MTKPFTIVIGILALGALIVNIYMNPKVSHLFGKEINDWLYRAFWLLIVGVCVYNYIYIEQNTLKNRPKSKLKSKN